MTDDITRRAALGAVPALAAGAIPAAAAQDPSPEDPIFEAIERHRVARQRAIQLHNQHTEACRASEKAWAEFIEARALSRGGTIAKALHVADCSKDYTCRYADISNLLRDITTLMIRETAP